MLPHQPHISGMESEMGFSTGEFLLGLVVGIAAAFLLQVIFDRKGAL